VAFFAIWERYGLRAFENRSAEEKEKLTKLRNDKLHYMHSPQNISGVIKTRQMRRLVHGGRREIHTGFSLGSLREKTVWET